MDRPKSEPETFDYDVFLSHSSKDKAVVLALAERLKAAGLRVWLDDWEIRPGDLVYYKIQDGLARSRILILFMSQHSFGSDWVTLEHQTILFRDPLNRDRRFLPLRLDDADIPAVLRQFKYLDWQTPADVVYQSLLLACRADEPASESARPASKPGRAHSRRRPPSRRTPAPELSPRWIL